MLKLHHFLSIASGIVPTAPDHLRNFLTLRQEEEAGGGMDCSFSWLSEIKANVITVRQGFFHNDILTLTLTTKIRSKFVHIILVGYLVAQIVFCYDTPNGKTYNRWH